MMTHGTITEDIWAGGCIAYPEGRFLARKGDIVMVEDSPFADYPLTFTPAHGVAFCGTFDQVKEIEE